MRHVLLSLLLILLALAPAPWAVSDVQASEEAEPACDSTTTFPQGTRLVRVGFWRNNGSEDDCTGEPLCTNAFPVDQEECFAWKGRSGENSATDFTCNPDGSFSYTQWTTLTCEGGEMPEGNRKTAYPNQCHPDTPDTLRSMLLDYSGCEDE